MNHGVWDQESDSWRRDSVARTVTSLLTPGLWSGLLFGFIVILLIPWPAPKTSGTRLPRHARARLKVPEGRVRSLAFTPDGSTLVLGCGFETIRMYSWDLESLAFQEASNIDEPGPARYTPAISPDGRKLATMVDSRSLAIRDLMSGTEDSRFELEFCKRAFSTVKIGRP